jgi:hypothetical protein
MNLKTITTSLLALATVAALPVATLAQSEGRSKTSQCNQIVAIANTAVTEAKAITNSGQSFSPEAMLRAANAMETAAVNLEKLSITDQRLQSYRQQFASMYRQTGTATRNFVTAFNQRNRPEAESALQALQDATGPEKQLVADINNYCTR